MTTWKDYTENRIISENPSGFYVIAPKDRQEHQPIFCPVCNRIMRSSFDQDSFLKFNCCDSCSTTWAYPNKEKWKKGWRPTSEEVRNKYVIDHI